jgi:hypothetical protein
MKLRDQLQLWGVALRGHPWLSRIQLFFQQLSFV